MDRLTRKVKQERGGRYYNAGDVTINTAASIREVLIRLAAYEDTGKTPEEVAALVQAESEGRIVPNIKEGQVFISQNSVVEHAHWSGDLWMDSLNGLHFVFHEANDGYDWQVEAKYVHSTYEAAEAALAAKGQE